MALLGIFHEKTDGSTPTGCLLKRGFTCYGKALGICYDMNRIFMRIPNGMAFHTMGSRRRSPPGDKVSWCFWKEVLGPGCPYHGADQVEKTRHYGLNCAWLFQ